MKSQQGPGWLVSEHYGKVLVQFDEKPDGDTLRSLKRASFTYDPDSRTWWIWATPGRYEKAVDIAMHAVTWESVGEDPGDWMERDDYLIFHDH